MAIVAFILGTMIAGLIYIFLTLRTLRQPVLRPWPPSPNPFVERQRELIERANRSAEQARQTYLERQTSTVADPIMLAGALSNATVILANGGFMPVIGLKHGSILSVWKAADENSRLLLLADRAKWKGFSIGDFFIIGGLILTIVLSFWK